jgi:L-threonylcarbamoyladenylate synthase
VVSDNRAGRAEAIAALRRGRLVALPTDTVYGLAVALDAVGGLGRLFAAKERPLDRGIVLLVADHRQAETVGLLDAAAHVLAAAFWPGALTLVVAQRPDAELPPELTGGAATVGLRLPAHDAPRALAAIVGPLPVSSANRSGEPPATDVAGVIAQLGNARDLEIVLDGGPAAGGIASTVVDCAGGPARILRPGGIPADVLAAVLDEADLAHRLRD